jgi:hypothetical protein
MMRRTIAMLLSATFLAACSADPGQRPAAAEPPTLGAEATGCDRPEAPGARGREAAAAGRARAQRYPFAAREGRTALELLATAQACLELAHQDAEAHDVKRQRAALLDRMERDYRVLRIRLSRARAAGRHPQALRAARGLLALLEHVRDPYVDQLRALEHRLAHRAAEEAP